jgi:hypothetical protein
MAAVKGEVRSLGAPHGSQSAGAARVSAPTLLPTAQGGFLPFLPHDNQALGHSTTQAVVECINEDLAQLLRAPAKQFWGVVQGDKSLVTCLDSFLKHRRWGQGSPPAGLDSRSPGSQQGAPAGRGRSATPDLGPQRVFAAGASRRFISKFATLRLAPPAGARLTMALTPRWSPRPWHSCLGGCS